MVIRRITVVLLFVSVAFAVSASDQTVVIKLPKTPMPFPDLVLTGRLGKSLTFSNCKLISGLTCTIRLIKGGVLPSRIYFTEVGKDGKNLSKPIRLIYPNVQPGERGLATFGLDTDAAERLVLRGEWKGAWRSAY